MRIQPLAALVACLMLSAALPARAELPTSLNFTIFKEKDPIGSESYAIARDQGKTTVQVQTNTRVQVLFLDFHYTHQRTETWQNGQIERLVAQTDDDGTIHKIDASASRAVIDGADKQFPGDALPLSLWSTAILNHGALYSIVDGQVYKVSTKDLGEEALTINNKQIKGHHWRLSGDVDRDLWFDNDGLLLKATFERKGYPITVLRQ